MLRNLRSVKSKRAQGAVEFAIIFGAVLFFFAMFFTIIQGNINDKNKEKEKIIAQNIALDIRDEINLAAESSEGYFRDFSIPTNVLGKEYTVQLDRDKVFLTMGTYSVSYKIHNSTGPINKGLNVIKKENGTIVLN